MVARKAKQAWLALLVVQLAEDGLQYPVSERPLDAAWHGRVRRMRGMLSVAADLVSSRRSAAILEGLTQSKPRSLPEPRARPRGDKIRCKATAAARVVARRRRRVRDGLVGVEQFKQLSEWLGNEKVGIQVEAAVVREQSNARDIARRDRVRNCLLYTSPSPRDRTRSRMPSSA